MKVSDLKKALEGLHDDAEVFIETGGLADLIHYKPAKIVGEFVTRPAGAKATVTSWALVLGPNCAKSDKYSMVDDHLEYPTGGA